MGKTCKKQESGYDLEAMFFVYQRLSV